MTPLHNTRLEISFSPDHCQGVDFPRALTEAPSAKAVSASDGVYLEWAATPYQTTEFSGGVVGARLPGGGGSVMLYDASAGTPGLKGRTPDQQGWQLLGSASTYSETNGILTITSSTGGGSIVFSAAGNGAALPSQPLAKHPLLDDLDAEEGFTVSFGLRVASGTTTFQVFSDDPGYGVMLRLGTGSVKRFGWTSESQVAVTEQESVSFDTTTAFVDYDLSILGNEYSLFADDELILHGTFLQGGHPSYQDLKNCIFLGDDAGGTFNGTAEFTYVSYTPEPATLSMLALGGLALIRRRRKA